MSAGYAGGTSVGYAGGTSVDATGTGFDTASNSDFGYNEVTHEQNGIFLFLSGLMDLKLLHFITSHNCRQFFCRTYKGTHETEAGNR
jgi:hypothetical protein